MSGKSEEGETLYVSIPIKNRGKAERLGIGYNGCGAYEKVILTRNESILLKELSKGTLFWGILNKLGRAAYKLGRRIGPEQK